MIAAVCGQTELYDNTSTHTETREIRSYQQREVCKNVRLLAKFQRYVSALHSIALIDPNSIQVTSISKVVCLSSGQQTQ